MGRLNEPRTPWVRLVGALAVGLVLGFVVGLFVGGEPTGEVAASVDQVTNTERVDSTDTVAASVDQVTTTVRVDSTDTVAATPSTISIIGGSIELDGDEAVYVIDADGDAAGRFLSTGFNPAWSPDGSQIAFGS